jgi:polyhydroxyalkanoate synthase
LAEASPAGPFKGVAELVEFQRKLAETTRQLARMRDHHVDLATLPKTEVHRIGSKVLYRCPPPASPSKVPPVLVTYALVGRYTILDLQEDRSFLRQLVDAVRARSGHDAINLFGICQGGVIALCHAALFPEKLRNLMLAVTPVDFHADQTEHRPDRGFMNVWARALEAEDNELMVEGLGNLPGDIGGVTFSMMTPLRSLTKYNLTLVDVG